MALVFVIERVISVIDMKKISLLFLVAMLVGCSSPVSETPVNETEVPASTSPAVPQGQTGNLAQYSNDSVGFAYPAPFPAEYVSANSWPPTINYVEGTFSCDQSAQIINGQPYCVEIEEEGAAGSIYKMFSYTTEQLDKLVTLTFVLQYVQCQNYDNPAQAECLNQQANFSVDDLADGIVQSLEIY